MKLSLLCSKKISILYHISEKKDNKQKIFQRDSQHQNQKKCSIKANDIFCPVEKKFNSEIKKKHMTSYICF